MIWKKLGMIFSAEQYDLIYAKSPQAIVFDDYIRVYFSTCREDGKKLHSFVKYIDYSKDFSTILNISKDTVLTDGKLGCYDEHGVFPFSPLKYNNRLLGYISGWTRRVSVSCDSGIGLAESFDNGNTFTRLGDGPVLSTSLEEPFLVIDGFAKYYDEIFHMWYIYGINWQTKEQENEPDRTYRIAHATSQDGINWRKEGRLIIEPKSELECQALPSVIKIGNKYHMFFCYRDTFDFRTNQEHSYRLGYAYSTDLVNWQRADEFCGLDLSESGWDSEMMCYPNVIQIENDIYILYNGNHFGKDGFGAAKLINE